MNDFVVYIIMVLLRIFVLFPMLLATAILGSILFILSPSRARKVFLDIYKVI